ncbi:MAG: class I SAM-dependent methyltransferase [Clostridia bacterium]|nr:class I SAM-dependent methyltransferase [Clostridia bacterium]
MATINLLEIEKSLPNEIAQLCKDFESINKSMMNEKMYRFLAASIMSAEINDPDYLLEIGTFRGLTAVFIAKLLNHMNKNNKVVSIDPFQRLENGRITGNHNSYMNNIINHEVQDQCIVISAFSQQIAPIIPGNIPFILIDGGHSYEDVMSDFQQYLYKLKIGGIALIDDPKYAGVAQAINEYIRNNNSFEILTDGSCFVVKRLY